eukprot:UN23152
MRFVSAAANLRLHQFHMPHQSYFQNKGIAGNIVHAIATSNAIVASVMVMETIKILCLPKDEEERQKEISNKLRLGYINDFADKRLWYGAKLEKPNSKCAACQKSRQFLQLDYNQWTFGDFASKILIKHLSFNEPDVSFTHESLSHGSCYIEYEDDLKELEDKKLSNEKIGLK